MLKKTLSILLSLCILFGVLTILPLSASATDTDIAETGNPYPQYNYYNSPSDYQISCTYYAWEQAYNNLGVAIPDNWGHAGSWYGNATNKGSTPVANSIACWSFENSPLYGHVAYVTGVNADGSINIVEGGSNWPQANAQGICSRKVNRGQYWPDLGFIYLTNPISYAKMDVNFWVDGKAKGNLDEIGYIQVYVDGQLQMYTGATSYTDFYQDVEIGKTYEVKVNITNSNYHFGGVDTKSGSGQTGTTSAEGTNVRLVIVKDSGGTTSLPNGTYQIVSVLNEAYGFDIPGNDVPAKNCENVHLYQVGTSPRLPDCFDVEYLGNGYYSIKQMKTDMSLDVFEKSTNINGNIMMSYSNGGENQQWKLTYDSNQGVYLIQSKCSGLFISYNSDYVTNGSNIYQDRYYAVASQFWKLIPISTTAEPTILPTEPIVKHILGDVDDDGEVGVIDATYIQRFDAGFNIPISEEDILARGDVDGDEEVTVLDATYIQRYDAGFDTPYPIGEAI